MAEKKKSSGSLSSALPSLRWRATNAVDGRSKRFELITPEGRKHLAVQSGVPRTIEELRDLIALAKE